MRSALRDAEATPPADGWARLERELGSVPAPRKPLWRIRRVRVAAAAAAVLLGIVAGEVLWHAVPETDDDLPVVALFETLDPEAGTPAASARTDAPSAQTATSPVPPQVQATVRSSTAGSVLAAAAPALVAQKQDRSAETAAAARSRSTSASGAVIASGAATASGMAAVSGTANASGVATVTGAASASDSNSAAASNTEAAAALAPGTAAATTTATATASAAGAASAATAAATTPPAASRAAASAPAGARSATTARTAFSDNVLRADARPRRRTSMSLFAAGGVTAGKSGPGLISRSLAQLSGEDEGYLEGVRYADYRQGSFRHHQPLSFGLAVRKELGHGFSVETGAVYTLLWADVRMPLGTEDFSQKLHFIGVPVRANWNFLERKNIILYIGAGGMVETCVAAKFGSTDVARSPAPSGRSWEPWGRRCGWAAWWGSISSPMYPTTSTKRGCGRRAPIRPRPSRSGWVSASVSDGSSASGSAKRQSAHACADCRLLLPCELNAIFMHLKVLFVMAVRKIVTIFGEISSDDRIYTA